MEISLKNIEIINSMTVLKYLLQIEDKDFDIRTRLNLARNMKKIEYEYKLFSEVEMSLLNQFALKDENGNFIMEDDGKEPKFAPNNKRLYLTKHDELLNEESTLNMALIKLNDIDKYMKTGEMLYFIEFMIDDSDDN